MELKLFGLLSSGFSFGSWLGEKWNRRIVFSDVMKKGLFAMFVAIKNGVKKRKDFCIESSMFYSSIQLM